MITVDPEKIMDTPMTFAFATQLAHSYIIVYYCNNITVINNNIACDWILENLPSTHKRHLK